MKKLIKSVVAFAIFIMFGMLCLNGVSAKQQIAVFAEGSVTFSAIDGTNNSKASENYDKAIDGKKSGSGFTKWCYNISSNPYIVIKASQSVVATGYVFTTGNDNADSTKGAGRNPSDWTLSACNDFNQSTKTGTWQTLDTKSDNTTMQDINFKDYTFNLSSNRNFYQYYKFQFTAVQGNVELFQLSEIALNFSTTCIGHSYGDWANEVPATCTSAGTKAHKTCVYCNKNFDSSNNEILDLTLAAGHSYGDWEAEVSATCSSAGTKGHKTCLLCNKHFDADNNEIADLTLPIVPSNHSYGDWEAEIPATCTNTGTKAHKTCSLCHKHFDSDNVEISDLTLQKLDHDWQTTQSFNATCTTDAYDIQTCNNCSETQKVEGETKATGHVSDQDGNCTVCYVHIPKSIGNLLVVGGQENVDYRYSTSETNTNLVILTNTKIWLSQTDISTPIVCTISVESTTGANITLAGVNINNSTKGTSPLSIKNTTTGNVVITLENGTTNTLIAGENCAGLQKVGSSILIIDGTGTLNATGGKWSPGIGADKDNFPGEIRFNGGVINATCGEYGVAIGSGYMAGRDGSTATTTLIFNGGIVNADASDSSITSQAIGGVRAIITINGGLITAESGYGGAAIGGSISEDYPKVTISGGSIRTIVNPYPYGADDPYANDFGKNYQDTTKIYAKNSNDSNLYSLVFFNEDALPVYVDGVETNMTIHSSGYYFLYLYLTGEEHTIQAGDELYTYTFNSETESFTKSTTTTTTLSNGLVVEGDGTYPYENTDYTFNGKVLTILTSKAMKITSNGEVKNRIVVKKDVSANLTLAGVNINLSSMPGESALLIEDNSTATVTITLQQNTINKLVSGDFCAGIQKNGKTGNLIIQGAGTLVATGGKNSAGIGGSDGGFATGITVKSGVVTATGGNFGSGIGGGAYHTATNISISGGSVKAVGKDGASSIGYGYLGGMACIPQNDASSNVYLLVVANQNDSTVTIDGEAYAIKNHSNADSSDKNLYVYLTGEDHNITVGENTFVYHYNNQFILCAASETINKDETQHWFGCVHETCTTKHSAVAHSYTEEIASETYLKTSATCTELAVYYKSCICGEFSTSSSSTFTHGELEPHDYDKTTWLKSETEHYYKCKNCNAQTDNQTHAYSNSCDVDCAICGYERSNITHDFVDYWTASSTGSGHYHVCRYCDETTDEVAHNYVWIVADDNTKHIKRCTDCYHKDNSSLAVHTYKYTNDTNYHWQQCTLCGKEGIKYSHSYDNYCDSICNQEGCGYDRQRTPHEDIYYTHGDEYHKKRCSRCNTILLEEPHNMQMHSDGYYHWGECVCGFSTEPIRHRYENDTSTTCRICNHERLQKIENVEYTLSGYTLNGKIGELTIAPSTANGLKWDDEYCIYWEYWWVVTDLDAYFNSNDWENYVVDQSENAYFAPNQDYWLGFYLYPEDDFDLFSLNSASIKVGGIEHMYLYVDYNYGSPYAYAYVQLPKLTGNNTVTAITQLEYTLLGTTIGSPATGLTLQADASNTTTNIEIYVYNNCDYDNPITDSTVMFDDSCWDADIYIKAPENYSFVGFTQDMLTINNLEGNYELTVSAGGGMLKIYCSLLPVLDSTHQHQTSTYGIDSNTHITTCEICNKTISTGIHSYTNDSDEDCNVCGYHRIMYINSVELTLTGYELGSSINQIAVSPTSTLGLDWDEPEYYKDWVVCCNIDSNNGIVEKEDYGVFITGKEYWLMVNLSAYPYNYKFSDDFSEQNITLVCVGTPEYIYGSNSYQMAYFKLPTLTGNDPTQKISNLEISLSNYQVDELIKNTTFVYDSNKIKSIEISLLQDNGRTINMQSDEKYFASGKYVLSFLITANTGYTFDGFTLQNLSFANATEDVTIVVGAGGGYVYVRSTLKTLAGEHTCDFTSTYWYTDTAHYNRCSYCSAKTNVQNHVYDNDEDITCDTCNYVRRLYVEEIEFEIVGYEYNNLISNMYLTTNSKGVDNTKYAVYGISHVITQDSNATSGMAKEYIEDDFETKFQRLTQYYIMIELYPKTNYYYKDMKLSSLSLGGYKAVYYSAPSSSIWGKTGLAVFKLPYLSEEHEHVGTWETEVPATCSSTGTKAHYECTTCHKNFDENNVEIFDLTIEINPDNHKDSEYLHDDEKHWKICPDCGTKILEKAHHGGNVVNGQKKKCEDCQTSYGKYMITSLDFKLTGYEVNKKITDITLSLEGGDCGIDFTKHSYDRDTGWFVITDINRFYNDTWWERDYFLYVIDDPDENGWFLPNTRYYLYVRFRFFNNDEYDYSMIDCVNDYLINGQSGEGQFANTGYFVQNYFILNKLSGTSTVAKASAVDLQLNGHAENAVITSTSLTETSATPMLSKAPSINIYKDGTVVTDNTIVYDTTSRFTFDITLTAKSGYTFEGFTVQDVSIDGIGNPDTIKISASGGKLFATFRMPSLMGEHEHTYGDWQTDKKSHWHECSLCFEHLHKAEHVYDDGAGEICNICSYARTFYIEQIQFNIDGYEVDELITDVSISATSLNNGAVWKNSGKYGVNFDYVITSYYSYSQNRKDYVDTNLVAYFMPNIEYTLFLHIYTKNGNYSFDNISYTGLTLNNAKYRTHSVTKYGDIQDLYVVFDLNKLTTKSEIAKAPKQTFALTGYANGSLINDAVLSLVGETCGTEIVSAKFVQNNVEIASTSTECFDQTKKIQIKVVLGITGRYTFFGFTQDDLALADGYRFSNIEINTSGSQISFTITAKSLMGEHEHTYGEWQTDNNTHWHECNKCFAYVDNGNHVFSNDSDTTCDTCGYKRKLSIKSITLTLTGYVYGNTVSKITLMPIESQKLYVECGSYGETFFFATDESVLELEEESIIIDTSYTLGEGIEYYIFALVAIASEDYTLENLSSISIQNFGEAVEILPFDEAECFVFFKLPKLSSHTHSGTWVTEVPATCTSTGTKAHKTCLLCNKHFDSDNNEIADLTLPALGHDFGKWNEEVPATNSTDGTKAHKTCSLCHKHFDENDNEIVDLKIQKLSNPEQNNGLSTGAIVAIAISSTVVVSYGGFVVYWCVIKKRKFKKMFSIFKKKK